MSINAPSASYSLTVRLEIDNKPGMLGKITSAIGKARRRHRRDRRRRRRQQDHHPRPLVQGARRAARPADRRRASKKVGGVRVVNVSDRTFLMHLGGKIETHAKVGVKTRDDLAMVYTPGVARVCMAIHHDPEKAYTLT